MEEGPETKNSHILGTRTPTTTFNIKRHHTRSPPVITPDGDPIQNNYLSLPKHWGPKGGKPNLPENHPKMQPTCKETSPRKKGQLGAKIVREKATGSRTVQQMETYQDKVPVHKVQVQAEVQQGQV